MDERFKMSHEADAAFAEMATVVHKGSVLSYINKLVNLNEKANISGPGWRSMLVKGLPHKLRKDLAKMPRGKPEGDDALIVAMNEVGLAHEQYLREEKLKERTTSACHRSNLQTTINAHSMSRTQDLASIAYLSYCNHLGYYTIRRNSTDCSTNED